MAFNNQLTKLRKRKNITQNELADMLGVKQYVISSWEIGRSEPNINQIIALSNIFNISTDYLLDNSIIRVNTEEEFYKIIENIKQDTQDDVAKQVSEICKDLPKSKQDKLLHLIKELVNY